MNKDVIYIDVEDDITAIIGKVKASREKIVALVPPKRIGVLQSAVNLRLLQRAATQSDKRIVLITNNQALAALSAAASIPIAKNLQSKPEIAEIPALDVDNGEDVIDGSRLPVGDLARMADNAKEVDNGEGELIEGIDIADAAEEKPVVAPKPIRKSSPKVPDFNRFRKKIFIGIGAGVALIALLVWAFVFAPAATIEITARTTSVPVSGVVTLGTLTDAEEGSIKTATQTIEREASVDFEATGEKDVGEKATGSVNLRGNAATILVSGFTVPAGTQVESASGKVYYTDSPAVFPQGSSSAYNNGVTVGVTAAESGESYNGASGVATASASGVTSASFVGATSGGTTKVVAIVTAADVQKAKEKLVADSTDAVRSELKAKFPDSVQVIEASFVADRADATATPAVGQEAPDKKAKLTSKVTYRLNGIEKSELEAYLTEVLKKQMQDQTTQKVYKTGADKATMNDFNRQGDRATVRLVATGHIGPVIDETEVKEKVAGKRFGDIQGELSQIDGVSDVKVDFSFFWVRTVPKDIDRITVEFNIENASE